MKKTAAKTTPVKASKAKKAIAPIEEALVNNTAGGEMPNPDARHRGSPRKDMRNAFAKS